MGDASPRDYTGRGGLYSNYVNHSDYLIIRKGERPPVDFTAAMQDADFCYSPLGQVNTHACVGVYVQVCVHAADCKRMCCGACAFGCMLAGTQVCACARARAGMLWVPGGGPLPFSRNSNCCPGTCCKGV